MCGETHATVGVASAVMILQPKTMEELLLISLVGGAAGIIPDIDIKDSKARIQYYRGVKCFAVFLVFITAIGRITPIKIISSASIHAKIFGICLFLSVCFVAILTKHRTFTHSIVGLLTFSLSVYLIDPYAWKIFAVGMSAHLFLDLTTKSGIPLFYPLRKEYSFRIGRTGDLLDTICGFAGSVVVIYYISTRFL